MPLPVGSSCHATWVSAPSPRGTSQSQVVHQSTRCQRRGDPGSRLSLCTNTGPIALIGHPPWQSSADPSSPPGPSIAPTASRAAHRATAAGEHPLTVIRRFLDSGIPDRIEVDEPPATGVPHLVGAVLEVDAIVGADHGAPIVRLDSGALPQPVTVATTRGDEQDSDQQSSRAHEPNVALSAFGRRGPGWSGQYPGSDAFPTHQRYRIGRTRQVRTEPRLIMRG
jgi:hypothetical protein